MEEPDDWIEEIPDYKISSKSTGSSSKLNKLAWLEHLNCRKTRI